MVANELGKAAGINGVGDGNQVIPPKRKAIYFLLMGMVLEVFCTYFCLFVNNGTTCKYFLFYEISLFLARLYLYFFVSLFLILILNVECLTTSKLGIRIICQCLNGYLLFALLLYFDCLELGSRASRRPSDVLP